jgi:aryl-alcohol dehydrogenase-like predicted oxidoreductase
MSAMPKVALGSSGIEVSRLALGSWRTYERMPLTEAVAVMRSAREAGINFLDDARYNDETGNAPIQTGYSEIVFGEVFRASGWDRDEVVLANKLWWEFWPRENAAEELDGSLRRMRIDRVDLIYSDRPPQGLPMRDLVVQVGRLIDSGKARAWGVLNYPPALLEEATEEANHAGLQPPSATQLRYSVAHKPDVEDPAMVAALHRPGVAVVASYVLDGGTLTGKYAVPGAKGRLTGGLDDERSQRGLALAPRLGAIAERLGASPASVAIAFALLNPVVAAVLFGATSPAQLADNVAALDVLARLDATAAAELKGLSD